MECFKEKIEKCATESSEHKKKLSIVFETILVYKDMHQTTVLRSFFFETWNCRSIVFPKLSAIVYFYCLFIP